MSSNSTYMHPNSTWEGSSGASAVGLAVGLTLFSLLLGGAAGLLVYTQRRRLQAMWQPGRAKSSENDVAGDRSPRYTGMVRTQQSTGQAPIYENFKGQPRDDPQMVIDRDRSFSAPEESLYLQCDALDEAIYSNDPACNLFILPETQEEDVYIVPDVL